MPCGMSFSVDVCFFGLSNRFTRRIGEMYTLRVVVSFDDVVEDVNVDTEDDETVDAMLLSSDMVDFDFDDDFLTLDDFPYALM